MTTKRSAPDITAYVAAAPAGPLRYGTAPAATRRESRSTETRVRTYASNWDRWLGTVASELMADTRFDELVEGWRLRASALSSPYAAAKDPAYQEIIRIGEAVIPLILRELDRDGSAWFPALTELAGSDQAAGAETVAEAIGRWRAWGELHHQ